MHSYTAKPSFPSKFARIRVCLAPVSSKHEKECDVCRGCGGTPLTNAKPLHIALSADVYEAVQSIRENFADAPVFLVGFSIGAYTMTKYVAEADSGVWPEGAAPPSSSCLPLYSEIICKY